jgi:hypothetical protein
VSECDREASIIRWPWPTGGCSNDRRPHCDCGRRKQIQNVATEHDDFQIGLAVLMGLNIRNTNNYRISIVKCHLILSLCFKNYIS